MNAPFYYTGIAFVVAGLFLLVSTIGITNELAAFGLVFASVGGIMIWYSKKGETTQEEQNATN